MRKSLTPLHCAANFEGSDNENECEFEIKYPDFKNNESREEHYSRTLGNVTKTKTHRRNHIVMSSIDDSSHSSNYPAEQKLSRTMNDRSPDWNCDNARTINNSHQ